MKGAQSLGDLIRDEEARIVANSRREIAAEDAAWKALSDEERAAITAEREAKWDAFADACESAPEDDDIDPDDIEDRAPSDWPE